MAFVGPVGFVLTWIYAVSWWPNVYAATGSDPTKNTLLLVAWALGSSLAGWLTAEGLLAAWRRRAS